MIESGRENVLTLDNVLLASVADFTIFQELEN